MKRNIPASDAVQHSHVEWRRWGLAARLLQGMEAWGVQFPKQEASSASAGSTESQAATGQHKRGAKHESLAARAARREFRAPGADTLIAQQLSAKAVREADYYALAELLVRASPEHRTSALMVPEQVSRALPRPLCSSAAQAKAVTLPIVCPKGP